MVTAESRTSKHAVSQFDCNVRIQGSCGTSRSTSKGTLTFRLQNDRDGLVPIALEVLVVPNLGANIFSVGALDEKGVEFDLLLTPPALRKGEHAFLVSREVKRMYLVNLVF